MNDLDLIAALAEGSLSGDDERRARALMASNREALHEYELQKAALRALHGADTPTMRDLERRRLHGNLRSLRPEPASSTPSRRRWPRLAFAAALVLVAAIAAPLLRSLSRDGGSETALPPLTTTTGEQRSTSVDRAAPEDQLTPTSIAAAADAPDEAAPPAVESATTTTAPPAETDEPLQYLGEFTQESLSLALADYVDDLAAGGSDGTEATFDTVPGTDLAGNTITVEPIKCRIEDMFPGSTVKPVGSATLDGAPVAIYRVESAAGGQSQVVTIDRASCEIVDV